MYETTNADCDNEHLKPFLIGVLCTLPEWAQYKTFAIKSP